MDFKDESGVFCVLLLLVGIFTVGSESFLELRTLGSVLTFCSVLGVIALGATVLMTVGEFDLSVGSTAALAGMVFAMGIVEYEMSSYLPFVVALLAGALVGLLNGIVTLKTKIPSFITTLGALLIWRGVVLAVSGGFPISLVEERTGILALFGTNLGASIYSGTLFWLALGLILYVMLKMTPLGNHLLAAGGNLEAARSRGISTSRIKLLSFVLSGTLAALAGVILFSELQDLSPTAGESYELYAIAAAVIGGTSLQGGKGTILGTVLGTLLIGTVQSGLIHIGADSYWFRTFVGILLIVAVVLNMKISQLWTRGRTA